MSKKKHNKRNMYKNRRMEKQSNLFDGYDKELLDPDYNTKCEVCGASPTIPLTGMCGPCTFGESDTVDGDW
jgi:hypothetical protein